MKSLLILLKREFLILSKNINSLIIFLFIFPIILYLFLVTPFYDILRSTSGMHYIYHAFPGILFLSTSFVSFLVPMNIINRDMHQSDYFFYLRSLNITIFSYISYVLLASFFISYLQFFISITLLIRLSPNFLISWKQIFLFSIAIMPSVVFVSLISLLLSNFIKSNFSMIVSLIFTFLFLSFGVGSFIPIEYFSDRFIYASKNYNIFYYLNDIFVKILQTENINIGIPITTFVLSIMIFILNYFIIKKNKGKY
mgnify:CR=1 FL=1